MDVTLKSMPFHKKSIDFSRSTTIKKLGFTLIELLITVTLIGILSGIVTFGVIGQQRKARDAQRKSDMQQVKKALQSAKNDCRNAAFYPSPAGGTENVKYNFLMNNLSHPNLAYLSSSLQDPKNPAEFYRYVTSTATTSVCKQIDLSQSFSGSEFFVLRAKLEVTTDPESNSSRTKCQNQINAVIDNVFITPPAANDGFYYVCSN